jgi:RNA-directed DNA polymerase
MKRVSGLFERCCARENLLLAFWKAARGKRKNADVRTFEENLDFGQYHYFYIQDPRTRLICAASFRERVAHHALMNVLDPFLESRYIAGTFACRSGKGTVAALQTALGHSRYWPWALKLDVRKYFDSIDHLVLKEKLRRLIKDRPFLDLLDKIIDSYSTRPGKGIPIGNLTSQHFANYYLSFLDDFILRKLKPAAYVRYMDDFALWDADREKLSSFARGIWIFAGAELALGLKPALIQSLREGIPFLGFRLTSRGLYLTRKTSRRSLSTLREFAARSNSEGWNAIELESHVLPVCAHLRLARSRSFRNNALRVCGLRYEPGDSGRELEQ